MRLPLATVATPAASAIKVFPLLVGAETTTEEPLKNACIASRCQNPKHNQKYGNLRRKAKRNKTRRFSDNEPGTYRFGNRKPKRAHAHQ